MEEAFAPGAVAKRVAERHEISTGLLFTWRRQLMADTSANFLPVQLTEGAERVAAAPPRPAPGGDGMIAIETPNGVRIRVGHGVDLKVLRSVLTVLGAGNAAGR